MKRLRVYVDMSVVGGCFDSEFAVWSNALMDGFGAERLAPVVSELVAAEVKAAPLQVQERLEGLLALGAEVLRIDRDALDLASEYTRHGVLPPRFRNDLLHIAMATVAGVERWPPMKSEELKAVEMTRDIRDRMYEETKDLGPEELLRYIKQRSAGAMKKVNERDASVAEAAPRTPPLRG